MNLSYHFLADQPEQTQMIVNWWSSVWSDQMGSDLVLFESQLKASLSKTDLPLLVVVYVDEEPAGTAAIKNHELNTLYPQNEYWLGSVYVVDNFRGLGIASELTQEMIRLAKRRALPHLYLQTQDLTGGLYGRLGWKAIETFTHDGVSGLLMKKAIS